MCPGEKGIEHPEQRGPFVFLPSFNFISCPAGGAAGARRLAATFRNSIEQLAERTGPHDWKARGGKKRALVCLLLTCALELGVEEVGNRFETQPERSVTPGQVAVGGEGRSGAGVPPQEAGQPCQVAVAQPLVLGQAQHSQTAQRLEQVARQRRQVVVVQRPTKRGKRRLRQGTSSAFGDEKNLQNLELLEGTERRLVDARQLVVVQLPVEHGKEL